MPIDPDKALGAEPTTREIAWTGRDVLLYHLSLGAGRHADRDPELRWTFERDLQVEMKVEDAVPFLQKKVEWFAQELGLSPARIVGWTFVKALGWECGSSVVTLFQKVAEPWEGSGFRG